MRFFKKVTPIILQSEMNECGLACIAMLAGYYGKKIDITSSRLLHNVTAGGMSVRELIDTFAIINMTACASRVEIEELYSLSRPVILHWELNHYVILTKIDKKKATINDPATGRRIISLAELSNKFTGVIIDAWITESFTKKPIEIQFKIMDLFKPFNGKYKILTGVVFISLVIEMLSLSVPMGTQFTIDTLLSSSDFSSIYTLSFIVFTLLIIKSLLSFARSIAIMNLKFFIGVRWAEMFFNKIINLKLPFFLKRHIGDITSRFQSLSEVRDGLDANMISSFLEVIVIIFSLIIMFYYMPLLLVPPLFLSIIYVTARLFFYEKYKTLKGEVIYHEAIQQSHFIESIRSISSIRMLNLFTIRRLEWLNYVKNSIKASNESFKLDLYMTTLSVFIQSVSAISIIIFSAFSNGEVISTGLLFSMLLYGNMIVSKTIKLTDSLIDFTLLSVHANRLTDIVLYPIEENGTHELYIKDDKDCIEIKNLAFKYNEDEPYIFHDVNLNIKKSENIAIVGSSGCGKSTLFKILSGLYEATSGDVFFYGVNSKELDKKNLRNNVAYVMQDDRLLSGTIAQNISSFTNDIDYDRVIECAKYASVHNEIANLPLSYETIIGDLGEGLSGGQIQRITIARALYRKPKILLLDETTSNLDVKNEAKINASIRNLPITKIFIAHRPETINTADRVYDLSLKKWVIRHIDNKGNVIC